MTTNQETINKIIFSYTREITNFEEKIAISTGILLLIDSNSIAFAEFLYTDKKLQDILREFFNEDLLDYNIDIDFFNFRYAYDSVFKNLKEQLIKKIDTNNYYKALFEKDDYALAVNDVANVLRGKNRLKLSF